jgi:ATP-dependent exoDNAse (exonuclease V) beta subunit
MDPDLAREPERDWRATGKRTRPPAEVLGTLVHAALARWWFPGDERFDRLMETLSYREGLVNPEQRKQAIEMAVELLERLRGHEMFTEIDAAEPRLHEVPYTYASANGRVDSGRIDLLYRIDGTWQVLDFKTDHIWDEEVLGRYIEEYRPQMLRYRQAVERLLGESPLVRLCFLDAMGEVKVKQV